MFSLVFGVGSTIQKDRRLKNADTADHFDHYFSPAGEDITAMAGGVTEEVRA